MKQVAAVWSFVAGDSRLAPLAVAIAVLVALTLERIAPAFGSSIGVIFTAIVAAGLVAGVFERTR